MTLESLTLEINDYIQANPEHIAYHVQRINYPEHFISHNAHQPMHIASAFKAFVAGATCQAIEAGVLTLDDEWTIIPEERLPDSIGTERLSDGDVITVEEALKLMIGVSDNTTTEMMMRRIDTQKIVEQLNLQATHIPPLLSDFINRAIKEDAEWERFSPKSSMADLTQFYQTLYQADFFQSPATSQTFWDIMRAEDHAQQTNWGEGVTCYRKSGSLELSGFYALSIAGIMATETDAFAFGIVCNARADEEEEALELAKRFSKMASALLRGLNRLLLQP